jgi:hypothetical protein
VLLEAAGAAGLTIDYIARESAFARYDEVPVAELVVGRLVDDPPRGANGTRPPVRETGWLCNGVRSPGKALDEAMRRDLEWRPPRENRSTRHSVFVDVELWRDVAGGRQWACAMLAAAWQLVRLGLVRFHGQPIMTPAERPAPLPDVWSELPPVIKVNDSAGPFAAYQTFSALAGRFLPIEHAVRTILNQVAVEPAVAADVARLAGREGVNLPDQIIDRIDYAFVGTPPPI